MSKPLAAGPKANRTATVSVCLNPKVHYLATLAARDQQRSLSSLIETAIRKMLTDGSFHEEPNYGHDITKPAAPLPMWGEGMYDPDPADRLFLTGTMRRDLLTADGAALYKLLCDSILASGDKLSIHTFRFAYNDPSVDKTHLEREA